MRRPAALALFALGLVAGGASAAPRAAPGTDIVRLDPALDRIVPRGAVLEKVAGGFDFVEGPLWVGGRLRFSDLVGNRLWEVAPGGRPRLLNAHSGGLLHPPAGAYAGSNGAAVAPDGTVLMCQHGGRRVVRVDAAGHITPVIERYRGKRLNSPNDLVFAPDGALWITDPPFGLAKQDDDPAKEQPFNAVYRWRNGRLQAAITDLPRPNGIAFSPDGRTLYVSNSGPEMFVNAYPVGPGGRLGRPRRLISYPSSAPDVPDGLKVDSLGNIWTTGPGGLRIVSPAGRVLGQLKSPDGAQANIAFGGLGWRDAWLMAGHAVYRLHLAAPGERPRYAR